MNIIYYFFKLLSFQNSQFRFSFLFPWIGIVVATLMLLLINGIMGGMEREIFASLEKLDYGYKIKELWPVSN